MFRKVRTKWVIRGIICTAAALAVVVLIMIMGTGKKKLPGADYAVGIGFEDHAFQFGVMVPEDIAQESAESDRGAELDLLGPRESQPD